MKQLLKKKQNTRIIVFTLMLTMLAWLAPANVGVAKAADNQSMSMVQNNNLKVSKKPLYKQCAGRAYLSKCKPGQNFAEIKFGKASKGKIKLYLGWGISESSDAYGTKALTGTVKGKTIKFKAKKWYYQDYVGPVQSWNSPISGTITIISKNTIKLKINSGKEGPLLKKGKTIKLYYDSMNSKNKWWY